EFPWESTAAREAFVRSKAKEIHSDYPAGEERKLDRSFLDLRLTLEPEEVERYRALGADAAKALTATLAQANGSMTEGDLSGLAAKACWSAGIQPMLAMAAGERRGLAFRHPITKAERLGGRAMIVICGRRHGLFANVTRHVFWREPSHAERLAQEGVLKVESAIFAATEQGLSLPDCYESLKEAYRAAGFPDDIYRHHQGGSTGYRTREEVASPESPPGLRKEGSRAYAWNPSLEGAKIEDTILRHPDGKLEVLTIDPAWPTREFGKRLRPDPWVRF
ncbi:MAG: M24 family metallopeptidase, partial [Proteobacteria bacterium]